VRDHHQPDRRSGAVGAEAACPWEVSRVGGSSPDKAGVRQDRQMVWARCAGPRGVIRWSWWPRGRARAGRLEAGMTVAWFTIEDLGALVRRHRADDSIARTLTRLIRTDPRASHRCEESIPGLLGARRGEVKDDVLQFTQGFDPIASL
jgi:hypothetical protein